MAFILGIEVGKRDVIVLRLGESVKEVAAFVDLKTVVAGCETMHFGPPIPSNIYPVGLSPAVAKTKV
jgi:hypothetical protein